jgi:hypothetical protein
MTSPQPMQMRRRGGAKRGDHGSYVAPAAETPEARRPQKPAPNSKPSGANRTGTPRSAGAASGPRRVGKPISEAAAAAKAAYDAKPKVIFRGVDEDVYFKLRAIYKHQLREADGVEGWSEFGRAVVLQQFVDQYEQVHGKMTGGENVQLPAGRRVV